MTLTSGSSNHLYPLDQARFVALWQRCAVNGTASNANAIFQNLLARYQETQRRYHSPEHIRHCLGQFDLAAAQIPTPDAVELALWFHDVVYDIEAKDNEAQSAALFRSFALHSMPENFVSLVERLIMVTMHPSTPQTLDEQFVVDIDLSSFALPWDEFSRDSVAVRAEKPQVSDQQFYSGHARFLSSLLNRPSFFITAYFRDRSEAAAQQNLQRYLSQLKQAGLLIS